MEFIMWSTLAITIKETNSLISLIKIKLINELNQNKTK